MLELGYSIAPGMRECGTATDAVRRLLREAFSPPEVQAVIAHTLAEPGPSAAAPEKTGFAYAGKIKDEEHGAVWGWRRDRDKDP